MGRKPSDDQQEEFLRYLNSGRDEMNLIEHSFASASKNVDRSVKSLEFTREDTDPDTGKKVIRQWKMSFSADYGRPTTRDDDVFVACMKLSAAAGFASREVFFTRYEMCRILGWSACGKNYRAIDEAFKRLSGVLIVARKYFYDNVAKRWVKKIFHIIEDVTLYEKEDYGEEVARGAKLAPRSSFVWSPVMQESFDAGYVRKLDLEVYRSLGNPIARKLYRYLGKQFWKGPTHKIALKNLCYEKLGYSQQEQRNPRLRQKIEPAIRELEEKGIYGLSHKYNASFGNYEVIFRAKSTLKSAENSEPKKHVPESPLLERLLKLGVDRTTATDAVKQLDAERIVTDIEHVEFLAKAGGIKSSKAGMLATMLKADEPWPRPQGFQSSKERELTKKKIDERKKQEQLARVAEDKRRQEQDERELAEFNEFMAGLSPEAAIEFEERAKQTFWFGERYRKALKSGDASQVSTTRQAAMFSVWSSDKKGKTKSVVVQKSIHF